MEFLKKPYSLHGIELYQSFKRQHMKIGVDRKRELIQSRFSVSAVFLPQNAGPVANWPPNNFRPRSFLHGGRERPAAI